MIHLLGYVAMACLMAAGAPQAYKSYKDGHSRGIAGIFLILLLSGFSLMSLYLLLTKPILPVLFNYMANIITMLVVSYYKLFPRKIQS
jgi:uncharacterized protein with PQ loop repeat